MKTNKRAYSLIEILIIIMAMVVLIALCIKPMRKAIAEIPHSNKVFQSWSLSLKMLDKLRQDVERSSQIVSLDNDVLTLTCPEGLITYTFSNGRVSCSDQSANDPLTWELNGMQCQIELWTNVNGSYAIQITTCHHQPVEGKDQTTLKQSYVFFQKRELQ